MNMPDKRIDRRKKIFQLRTASRPSLSLSCIALRLITNGDLSFSLDESSAIVRLIGKEFADATFPAAVCGDTGGIPEIDPKTL